MSNLLRVSAILLFLATSASCISISNVKGAHTCALLEGGEIQCWGFNHAGQVGDGTTVDRLTPTRVSGAFSGPATAISAGAGFTCALSAAGEVQCWGVLNTHVQGLNRRALQIGVGDDHGCALLDYGGVKCWGQNSFGQLGDGGTENHDTAVDVLSLPPTATSLSVGGSHSCVVHTDGSIRCWGDNVTGALGDGSQVQRNEAVEVAHLGGKAVQVSAGFAHSCAILSTGEVMCWGSNSNGQLGNTHVTSLSLVPVRVEGLAGPLLSISAGGRSTCGVTVFGAVVCWGALETSQKTQLPTVIEGLGIGMTGVSVGDYHSCALSGAVSGKNSVLCWGLNYAGQIGDDTTVDRPLPAPVSGTGSKILQISTGRWKSGD